MLKKLLPILLILSAFTILIISLYAIPNKYPNKQKDTILHKEREGVVEEKEEIEKQDKAFVEEHDVASETRRPDRQGVAKASWYDKSVCGKRIYGETCKTANGEVFSENKMAFAHRDMAFGTRVEFCVNSNCVIGICNDRGPYIYSIDFDFTLGLFRELANPSKGHLEIEWKII